MLDAVDSTNSYAKKLAMEDCDEGTAVIAKEQTEGRGRCGRKWHSGAGMGLYLSVVLRPAIEPLGIHILTLAASVAAVEAIGSAVEAIGSAVEVPAGIKWPNDILLDGKKVCGILTESVIEDGQLKFAVIGAGFNLKQKTEDFPEDLKGRAISLSTYLEENCLNKLEICSVGLAKDFLIRLDALYELIKKRSTDEIISKWREYSVTGGRRVRLVRGGLEYEAMAGDIDEQGRLRVICDNGEVNIVNSGEIFFV